MRVELPPAIRRYGHYGLIACGLFGALVVTTLPMREAPEVIRLFDAGGHGALVLAALLIGAVMGATNLARPPARWPALVAAIAFSVAIVGIKGSGGGKGIHVLVGNGANGGMALSFLGTLIAVMLALAKAPTAEPR